MSHWRWTIQVGVLAVLAAGAAAHAQAPGQLQSAMIPADVAAPGQPASGQLHSAVQNGDNAFLRFFRDGEWYASWGYSKQYWAPTDIHVSQPSLGNDFTIHGVHGSDQFAFSDLFNPTDLFGPEYNIRIGRFINDDRTIGVEFSLDHSKYTTNLGQFAQATGLVAGVPTNSYYQLTSQNFSEVLHNGANHVMANVVYRYPLIGQTNETLSVAAIAKAGVGVMLPHTTDTVLGYTNNVGLKTLGNSVGLTNGWWQLNGWTTGAELGFRVVLYKPVYLELTDKVAYANLSDLPAYQGLLRESLWMNEIVFSIGFTYDGASTSGRR
jgi:hypothetical protein